MSFESSFGKGCVCFGHWFQSICSSGGTSFGDILRADANWGECRLGATESRLGRLVWSQFWDRFMGGERASFESSFGKGCVCFEHWFQSVCSSGRTSFGDILRADFNRGERRLNATESRLGRLVWRQFWDRFSLGGTCVV